MNKKISSLLLLLVLSVTDAYLLAHPNLIGRLGVLLYKHSYIRNFPRALLTVMLIVVISLVVCEILFKLVNKKTALVSYLVLLLISIAWLAYVFVTFSSFSYRITGKAFIYGAHLLPIILIGLYGRYFVKMWLKREVSSQSPGTQTEHKL